MKKLKLNLIVMLPMLLVTNCLMSQNTNIPSAFKNYDEYVHERMQEWNIPGMAIAVVKGDSVLFQNNYGYSDVEKKTKVTRHTLFAIGSCTKFFTTTALSILADEKKVDFDAPVIKYYPSLKLKDSVLQQQIIVKDILSHRTGLERGDYIWYGANYSRKEILDRLVYLNTVAPVREAFIYNNMMYSLAGTIIEKQSGLSYETFVTQRVLTPIKMNNTVFDLTAAKSTYALPYSYTNSNFRQLPMPQTKGVEPAGGIWSDLEDMTKWLSFHLSKGKVDTTQIVSANGMNLLKTPVLFTGDRMRADESEYKSYGMGMGFSAYKGNRVMYHTGVAGGYTAHIAFLPEENIGIVILTNTETYTAAMIDNVFDRVLGLEQTDWNTPVINAVKEQWKEDEKSTNEQLLKIKNAEEVKDYAKYMGVYNHAFCKPVAITNKSHKVYLNYNNIEYALATVKENEFMAYDENVFGDITATFSRDAKGNVTGLMLELMGEKLDYKKTEN
ncbi:MAG: beta-lactamase family protein [Bacteroidetes bacterium]|nr:beta-lactamase family protein [Bacteroidota bacterium]